MGKYIPVILYSRGKRRHLAVRKPNGKSSLAGWALRVVQEMHRNTHRPERFAICYDRAWVGFVPAAVITVPPQQFKRFPSEAAADMWLMMRSRADA